jgi:hypothetical protein
VSRRFKHGVNGLRRPSLGRSFSRGKRRGWCLAGCHRNASSQYE